MRAEKEVIAVEIRLIRAGVKDAGRLWKMQVEAFTAMYDTYRDTETSPATEPVDKMVDWLKQPFTYYYYIQDGDTAEGAIRVIDRKEPGGAKRISPIFILPSYRNRGIAQKAISEAERLHGDTGWELDTILQEKGNCHLYEKMGYRQTGETTPINDRMTLVFYKKD